MFAKGDLSMKSFGCKKQQGSVLTEFLIVLAFIFPLLYGILEFGMGAYERSVMLQAVREGARAAARIDPVAYGMTPTVYQTALGTHAVAVTQDYLTAAGFDTSSYTVGAQGVELVSGAGIFGIEVTVEFPDRFWWNSSHTTCVRSVFLLEGQLVTPTFTEGNTC